MAQTNEAGDCPASRYLASKACGDRYGFSKRHWLRLVDAGKAPQPTRFGRVVRWSLADLMQWESTGCQPPCKSTKRKGGAK